VKTTLINRVDHAESGTPSAERPEVTGVQPALVVGERRQRPRFATHEPGRIRLLNPQPDVLRAAFSAEIGDVSEQGMRVEVPYRIEAGALVELKTAHRLILGEVCWCSAFAGPGKAIACPAQSDHPPPNDKREIEMSFSVGIRVFHCVSGLQRLEQQQKAFSNASRTH
jgi:hypothetical protein